MKTIYTIGDSHGWHAWLKIPNVIQALNFMTMYDFGRVEQVLLPELTGEHILCFCLGEVDCRFYVNRYPPYKETIDRLVKRYLEVISISEKVHPDIWIYNVVPPPREQSHMKQYHYHLVGSDDERLAYATYMNQRLRESKYPFIDIYDKFCDADGFMDMSKSDGYVHIADEKPLLEWVEAHR